MTAVKGMVEPTPQKPSLPKTFLETAAPLSAYCYSIKYSALTQVQQSFQTFLSFWGFGIFDEACFQQFFVEISVGFMSVTCND
jgi:hypothetical protein